MKKLFLPCLLGFIWLYFTFSGDQGGKKSESTTGPSITVSGYLASPSETLLDQAISYSSSNDEAALQELMNNGMVIHLAGGTRVEIVDTKVFQGKVKIRPVGETLELWTLSEAVR